MNSFSKYLSAFVVAMALLPAAGCSSSRTQEGTGEYVDDSVITAKVKAAIFDDPALKIAEINVETFKGVVQLSGFVSSRTAANKVVGLANRTAGVKSVKDVMQIK